MNWTCPYCNRPQTVTGNRFSSGEIIFYVGENATGPLGLQAIAICCSNTECLMPSITANICQLEQYANGSYFFPKTQPLSKHQLMPQSSAKPQPTFIPKPIREDYEEACKIRDLSPKASATLSRRCLQGMIRDFAGVTARSLFDEIEKLKSLSDESAAPKGVSEDSIEALHHIRAIGNIGAHMEKDINMIIAVEPEEAQLLLDVIETLFDEWYVARHKRETRFSLLKETADQKKNIAASPSPKQIEGPTPE